MSGGLVAAVTSGTDTVSYVVSNVCGTAKTDKIISMYPMVHGGVISGIDSVCAGSAVLLTDTVMPRMTGHELVQNISALRPDIKVIYMSGYLEFNASAHIQSGDGALYIQKPFSLDALGKIVRSAIESVPVIADRTH